MTIKPGQYGRQPLTFWGFCEQFQATPAEVLALKWHLGMLRLQNILAWRGPR